MIFKVQVLDGKGFGQEAQTLVCCASFAGAAKTTSVAAQEHLWNSTLTWSVSREELRSATSNTNHCKISVLRKDGTCLGWTVISLRSAKLQGQYKSDPQGLWLQLNATKLAEPPQLRVAYSLEDERRLPAPQQHRNRSPLILEHSNSSSSLASKASSGSLTSSSSGGAAEHSGWEAELGATATAAEGSRRQSAASEAQARKDRRSSAASLRPSRASSGSGSRRMSAAADAAAATGEDAAVGHAAAGESSSGMLAAEGTQELAAETATEALSHQQQPEASHPLHGDAVASAAGPEQAGTLQESPAAAEGSTAAAAAQPVTFGEEALAAVEAGLPSFAEQRRQQQEQQQQLQLQTEVQPPSPQQQQQEHLVSAQPVEVAQLALESFQPQAPAQDLAGQGQPAAALSAAGDMQAVLAAAGLATGTGVAPQQVLLPRLATSGLPAAEAAPQPATPDAAAAAGGQQVPQLAGVQADSVAALEPSWPAPDPVREFVLTLDVRSFQAGRRLPVALASIYVTAWLPQELVGFLVNGCGAKLPPRMTPLKTKPAVDIPRGSEGALPSGTASVSFACGVMVLAGQLAAEPRVTLEVWHKERLRSDLLLGVSSLPLSALLQECWVDGYAPVYALMSKASVAAGGSRRPPQQQQVQGEQEKVQVGLLRVVMSLEEKGPAQPAAASPAASPLKTTPSKRRQQQQQDVSRAPAPAAAAADTQQGADQARQQQQQHVGPQPAAADPDAAGLGAHDFRQMPEYLVAWELEVWRKAEEARFRAQLQELEQQRMGIIEAAWRAREAQRQSEISAMRSKYIALEKDTRELLSATQERERVLLAAEAELRLRKAGLEREAAARMTEAEAAVRRLQVECEHQLGIERERTAAALKQRDAAEARTAALEAQFTEYVASQRAAPEAQLKSELAETQQAVKAAEAKLAAAVKLKQKYKHQVQQLAREVAALHHKQQQDLLEQQQRQLAAALAREQDSSAAAKRAELAALRQELGNLKAAALAADAAAFGAPWGGMAHRPGGGGAAAAAAAAAAGVPGSPTCSSSSAGSSYRQHAAEQRPGHHKQGRSRHGKENLQWQEDDQLPARQRSQHVDRHHHHQHQHQQQEHGLAPEDLASDSGSSSGDDDASGSASSTGMLRLAAERSARETAAEVATIAAMLNPARGDNSSSSAARLDAGSGAHEAAAAAAAPSSDAAAAAGSSSSGSSPMAEVRRLLKEKAELLATGLYGRDDAVIGQIDVRVQALAELAATG